MASAHTKAQYRSLHKCADCILNEGRRFTRAHLAHCESRRSMRDLWSTDDSSREKREYDRKRKPYRLEDSSDCSSGESKGSHQHGKPNQTGKARVARSLSAERDTARPSTTESSPASPPRRRSLIVAFSTIFGWVIADSYSCLE